MGERFAIPILFIAVEIELTPAQPPEVAAAVARVLASDAPEPDPWWQAGVEESIDA
jgi:hypothetical protein